MRRGPDRRTTALVLLLAAGLSGPASASEPSVRLEREAAPAGTPEPRVGDRVPLRAVVALSPGYEVDEPRPQEDSPGFVLLPAGPARGEAAPGGGQTRVYPLELLVLDLGEVTFPGVAVSWTGPDAATGVAESGPVVVEVESAVVDPLQAEAADIRGPASLPVPFRLPWWLVITALAVALGLVFLVWLRQRPAAAPVAGPPQDPLDGLTAADWALREIETLVRDDWLGRRGVEAYHVRLAEIVRRYLEAGFGIAALERTTSETLLDVERRLRPLPGTRARLRQLLHSCDLVKFARLRPAPESALELAREARQVVDETRPPAPEPLREKAS